MGIRSGKMAGWKATVLLVLAAALTVSAVENLHHMDPDDYDPDVARAMRLGRTEDLIELGETEEDKEGFLGGSLMTTGNFVMMQSTGFDEEELGEGEGEVFLGGSLMTTGNFVMMQNTGFDE